MISRTLIRRAQRSVAQFSFFPYAVGVCFVFASSVPGDVDWASDLTSAIRQAEQSNSLVMVVDLPAAATPDDPIALANDAFRIGTIASDRMTSILRRQCVPVRREVGVPSLVRRSHDDGTPLTSFQRPVTYFCNSELKVVHFVVGYVAADRLHHAARWALDADRTTRQEATAAMADEFSQSKWLQIAHTDACEPADMKSIRSTANILRNSTSDLVSTDANDVRNVLKAVSLFHEKKTAELLGESLSKTPDRSELRNVSTDRALNTGHLVLALLPDIRLRQLQQPCYEVVAEGQCYNTNTPRIQSLDAYLADCARNERPVICLIHEFAPRDNRDLASPSRQQELLNNPKVQRRLNRFEIIPLLQAELAAIRHRRREPPIVIEASGQVLFAFFDKQGRFGGTICSDEPLPINLAQRLAKLE